MLYIYNILILEYSSLFIKREFSAILSISLFNYLFLLLFNGVWFWAWRGCYAFFISTTGIYIHTFWQSVLVNIRYSIISNSNVQLFSIRRYIRFFYTVFAYVFPYLITGQKIYKNCLGYISILFFGGAFLGGGGG